MVGLAEGTPHLPHQQKSGLLTASGDEEWMNAEYVRSMIMKNMIPNFTV